VKPHKFFSVLALALALQVPATGHAGVYSDDLGKCLVNASTAEDKQQLVQWVFFAISLNPTIKPYANISAEQRVATDKKMAAVFEKLLGESCVREATEAMKYEGNLAFSESFRLLGQVAGREIFASPEVAAGTENFTQYIDIEKLREKLGVTTK
jgi:hypothetical protein